MPAFLQAHVSYHPDRHEALRIAHDQWRTNTLVPPVCWDLELVEHFDTATRHVRPDDVADHVIVATSPQELLDRLAEMVRLGFDGVWVHDVGKDQQPFIEMFAKDVLPALRQVS